MLHHSFHQLNRPAFYSASQIKDLEFLLQQAVDRLHRTRTVEGGLKHPELGAFPRLAALVDHPHELTAFWDESLRLGLCNGTLRDALAGHAHSFVQEVVEELMAQHGDGSAAGDDVAGPAGLALIQGTFRDAFNTVFAHDLGPAAAYLDDDQEPMPGLHDLLTRVQQRRVLTQLIQVCVHHALHHRVTC